MSQAVDLIVLGAGPGGYVAAIRAAQLGLSVTLVEEKHLGGVCLNWGCIPTKALLRSAEMYHSLSHAETFGLQVEKPKVDFDRVIARSREVSKQLAKGVQHLLKKNKVEVVMGRGVLNGRKAGVHKVDVTLSDGVVKTLLAKNVVIATGARARTIPGLEVDGVHIWTAKEAMVPKALPKSLLVIGSGAIGIEFASFYTAFGTDVTVVEVQDRILPVEDAEISGFARKAFEGRGMHIHTKTTVEKLVVGAKGGVTATLKSEVGSKTVTFDKAIVAIGIIGNTEHLGLETTAIQVERNQIHVNEFCQTHEPGIYAIGDVAGAPWLAHKASHEGVMVAEKIAGQGDVHSLKKDQVPGCTYSSPQIASIGLTETKAKEAGYDIKVGRFPFMANGKAIAMGETEGLMKTIFDAKTGALLGAHLIGAEVTEMIQGFAIALTLEATEADLMHTIFPHPTMSEMMHESTLNAFGKALHF